MWNLIRRQALSMTVRLLVLLLYSKYISHTCPALHCYYTRVVLCIDSYNSHDARVKCHSRHCAFKHRLSKKLTPHRNAGMTQNIMTITLKLSVTDLITPFFLLATFPWRSWLRKQGESRSRFYHRGLRGESTTVIYVVSPKELGGLSCVYLGSSLHSHSNWRGRQILLVSLNKYNLKRIYGGCYESYILSLEELAR